MLGSFCLTFDVDAVILSQEAGGNMLQWPVIQEVRGEPPVQAYARLKPGVT